MRGLAELNQQTLINDQIDDMEESQILLNYNLFMDLIRESSLSPEQIYQGIQKLEVVYIQLTKEKENPQLIFESLNSTGLDLTQDDLIRNYLLMGQDYECQERLYNNKALSKMDTWNEIEITKRSEWLIIEICAIWQCPDAISLSENDVDTRTEFDTMDEVDVTGRTPCQIEICGGTIPVDSWRSFLMNICMQMYEYDAQIFRSLIRHKDFKVGVNEL